MNAHADLTGKNANAKVALITASPLERYTVSTQKTWRALEAAAGTEDGDETSSKRLSSVSITKPSELSKTLTQLDQTKVKLIWLQGTALSEPLFKIAKHFPKQIFFVLNAKGKTRKNVWRLHFKRNQGAYLAGIAAAETTKTNHIGVITNSHQPSSRFIVNFEKGVRSQAKKRHRAITVTVKTITSKTSDDKIQETVQTLITQKNDLILNDTEQESTTVFTAVKKHNETRPVTHKTWVISTDQDQEASGSYDAKGGQHANFVLTTITTSIKSVVTDLTKQWEQGKLPRKKVLIYDAGNSGVMLTRSRLDTKTWLIVQKARRALSR